MWKVYTHHQGTFSSAKSTLSEPTSSTSSPATITYNASPATTTSIEELESMWDPPFRRRNVASVVAQNMPTLVKPKTETGPPGYEAFAEAIRQGLARGKRDLMGFFTRDENSDGGMGVTECRGRWYDCMRKYGANKPFAVTERTLKTEDGCAEVGSHWDCAV
ncbi:hypothetical protein MMC34_004869 [Xylographa carneopallida]|nr:hypothetical protein [Xylographa carneopallida]